MSKSPERLKTSVNHEDEVAHNQSKKSIRSPTADGAHSRSSSRLVGSSGAKNDKSTRLEINTALESKEHVTLKSDHSTVSPVGPGVFKKAIVGDLFGTHSSKGAIHGFMYRSRIIDIREDAPHLAKQREENHDGEILSVGSDSISVGAFDSDSDNDNEYNQMRKMNPKQQLAVTIKNWTALSDNDSYIISEGAVYALIALSSIDDHLIRRCCASSFYHLSSRKANRVELLSIGTTGGVITLAQSKSRKVAKLCAMTLCYLSMEPNGESIMAKEGAIPCLAVLLQLRGHSLLPICIQTLYNMTATESHFKGVERIIKALLNVTTSTYDHSEFLIKALVNCARYSWMRLRIIEDGAILFVHSILPTLATRENHDEFVFHILIAVRLLSESSGCRKDMLQKGCIDILNGLLPHTEEKGKLLILKILHNLLQAPALFKNSAFEMAVMITVKIGQSSGSSLILQFCAACTHIFTKESLRGLKHLAVPIIDSIAILLRSTDPLTQYFSISTSGNLFFNNLCNNTAKIEQLVRNFVDRGSKITDKVASQALALALAKMSQEDNYVTVIEHMQLLPSALDLLLYLLHIHQDSLLLQESCCIAVCRLALRLENVTPTDRKKIADVFHELLQSTDQFVLTSTISGIRALGGSGLCPKELLSEKLLKRVANIIDRYRGETDLCRIGCGVMAMFSFYDEAHLLLADESIMQVLFRNINTEDAVTSEVVATTLCNISVNTEAAAAMIHSNVIAVIGTLSNSTSEAILELCAKCIGNLTCNASLHQKLISSKVLEIILMISLVRAVTNMTKLICAKALLNLITDENLPAIREAGAVRVFSTLSTVSSNTIQRVCANGFFLLSLNSLRREELIQRTAVLQSLFNMIKCTSSRIKIKIGTAVCNLLACPVSNRAAIKAGALSVMKIIATLDFEELRETTSRVIINLSQEPTLHEILLREPIVKILVLILQLSQDYTFESAIFALSSMSQVPIYRNTLIANDCMSGLMACILTGKVTTAVIAEEIIRCICHLSYVHEKALYLIGPGYLLLSMQAIYFSGICSVDCSILMALIMRNLSERSEVRPMIVQQDGFKLMVTILEDFNSTRYNCSIVYSSIVELSYNLCLDSTLNENLVEQGLMRILKKITLYGENHLHEYQLTDSLSSSSSTQDLKAVPIESVHKWGDDGLVQTEDAFPKMILNQLDRSYSMASVNESHKVHRSLLNYLIHRPSVVVHLQSDDVKRVLHFTHQEVDYMAKTIRLISETSTCHTSIVQGGVMEIFKNLILGLSAPSRMEVAVSLANLAYSKDCRKDLISQGGCELLIALSVTSDANTQAQCSLALGYLSELTHVKSGQVASMLLLSLKMEDENAEEFIKMSRKTVRRNSIVSINGVNPINPATVGPSTTATHQKLEKKTSAGGSNGSISSLLTSTNAPPMSNLGNNDMMVNSSGLPSSSTSNDNLIPSEILLENFSKGHVNVENTTKVHDAIGSTKLWHMLQDSITDRSKFHDFVDKLHQTSADGPMNSDSVMSQDHQSKLRINSNHAHIILKEEQSVLKCNFQKYIYEATTRHATYTPELAGMSTKALPEFPLPSIPQGRELEEINRHSELLKIPLNDGPLPKFTRKPFCMEPTRSSQSIDANAFNAVIEKDVRFTTTATATDGKGNSTAVASLSPAGPGGSMNTKMNQSPTTAPHKLVSGGPGSSSVGPPIRQKSKAISNNNIPSKNMFQS